MRRFSHVKAVLAVGVACALSACATYLPADPAGRVIRDVDYAPQLVVLRGGTFTMGAPVTEADRQPGDFRPDEGRGYLGGL
jgi:formylglycine-generating enzyme required for sulfatase activity